jgi:shikimate kinase
LRTPPADLATHPSLSLSPPTHKQTHSPRRAAPPPPAATGFGAPKDSNKPSKPPPVPAGPADGVDAEAEARYEGDYDGLADAVRDLAPRVRDALGGAPLYLVGMMGAGKSTVAGLLGAALGYPALDTDALVAAAAGEGRTVADVFAEAGEAAFRDAETDALRGLQPYTAIVVSTGGGAVIRPANWALMQHGVVVWLDGPPGLLAARAVGDGVKGRPLLSGGDDSGAAPDLEATTARMAALLASRRRSYENADIRVPLEAKPGAASTTPPPGAPPALVCYRVLRALDARLTADAAAREAARDFTITDAGAVGTMRVVPAKEGGGGGGDAAPGA